LRHPVSTALTISASLAQIGEFSFILAGLGVSVGLMPPEARDLILAGAIFSILANPILFAAVERLKPWLERRETVAHPEIQPEPEPEPLPTTALREHSVLVGYGRVGSV